MALDRRLAEALDYNDDWTGKSDPATRRKLQNRLNQRARRRRQAPNKITPLRSKISDVQRCHQVASTATAKTDKLTFIHSNTAPEITLHRRHGADLRFPLSTDHLIHLVQVNVYRALLLNMLSLGRKSIFTCTNNLDERDTRVLCALPLPSTVPPLLEPTTLQLTRPHAAWIDVFPLPALRDALIRAPPETVDGCALYADILGSIGNKERRQNGLPYSQAPRSRVEQAGIVVWGDPWLVSSWEVEEGFVRNWGWLLQDGCGALLQSTDRWRQLRGDEPMNWGLIGPGKRV